ncbi:hypothetical protein HPP92_000014 [Vanilla planifolia]|uniref:Uncharacterized protein n=1 Tax=Vanilla planifolia TaxID=51239 RepID=A0A835VFJ5_VANPL|nr:hypothetical protein HPP92_000014 [Vanilla planifolia]
MENISKEISASPSSSCRRRAAEEVQENRLFRLSLQALREPKGVEEAGDGNLIQELQQKLSSLRPPNPLSELGPEDSSRNIVEIIFQSSWLKKQPPACTIDRILKIHNSDKTIARFDGYRDSVKIKAGVLAKKHPRCVGMGTSY